MHSTVRPVNVASRRAVFQPRADGTLLVRPQEALRPYPDRFAAHLCRWAAAAPGRVLLAERGPDGEWVRLTYGEALASARALGQALLDRGLCPDRPLAILAGNGIAHLQMLLAGLLVGVPVVPVSTAYAAVGRDFAKLRYCLDLVTPGLLFVAGIPRAAEAVRAAAPPGLEVVAEDGIEEGGVPGATPLSALLATPVTAAVDQAAAAVGPGTLAKILFTSGSTGDPKGVITTHRMLCSNQQMILQAFPFLAEEPPVLLDWLPWNHVFGGNHDLGLVIANGGTLHVDAGRPLPGAFGPTLRNLRDVAPTLWLNVPRAFEELAPHLGDDPALCRQFFSRMRMMFYAAASLTPGVWNRMDQLAEQALGHRVQWMTGLGSTETAPFALAANPDSVGAGVVGLPVAGVELKLAPVGDKQEARVRGPSITPGYWRRPDLTAAAFDAEGFYCLGDALVLADPADPQAGFRFDGRVSEDFKLSSGTWVSVSRVRGLLLDALGAHVREVAVAGHDRGYLAVLAIPHAPELAACPATRAAVAAVLDRLAGEATGSAARVARFAWLTAPLSIDAGEMTDKGSVNQRAVLRSHAALVEQLYADPPPAHVICAQARELAL